MSARQRRASDVKPAGIHFKPPPPPLPTVNSLPPATLHALTSKCRLQKRMVATQTRKEGRELAGRISFMRLEVRACPPGDDEKTAARTKPRALTPSGPFSWMKAAAWPSRGGSTGGFVTPRLTSAALFLIFPAVPAEPTETGSSLQAVDTLVRTTRVNVCAETEVLPCNPRLLPTKILGDQQIHRERAVFLVTTAIPRTSLRLLAGYRCCSLASAPLCRDWTPTRPSG